MMKFFNHDKDVVWFQTTSFHKNIGMKKILLFVALISYAFSLSAQHRNSEDIMKKLLWDNEKLSILIDSRFDLQTNWEKSKLEQLSFKSNDLKVWLVGDLTPKIHFQIRQNLNKTGDVFRDGFSSATNKAWISFDLDDKWTITVGKQSVQFGTFEYDYNSADLYLPTMICNDLDASKAGVNVSYTIAKQQLNLQVVNSDSPQFGDEEYKDKALAANVLWAGDLFDGKVKTRWAYGVFQHSKKKFYNWITLGTQLNIKKFIAELDFYHGDRNMDYSSVVNDLVSGTRPVRDQSMALNLKYDFGIWKPSVKGIWDKRYDREFSHDVYERKGLEAVLECYPFTSRVMKDLRFHVAYTFCNTKFEKKYVNMSSDNLHTVFLGTRWMFKAK
jgi:hypothetical protein